MRQGALAISIDSLAPETPPHDGYRAAARRLRHRLRRRPAVLHEALCELSRRRDVECSAATGVPLPPQIRHGLASQFAQLVANRLEAGLLRYSRRAELLSEAKAMGIPRFEANLVIALVQHRAGGADCPAEEPKPRSLPLLPAFIAIQSLVVLAAWWLLRL